ncbi:MAG: phosphonoacetaldehyde hydrolase [Pirellula sp.]|jgi:phosphonoacetaldehyde hydrolase
MNNCYLDPSLQRHLKDIAAVLFDWAGTTIDFGSLAPVHVFKEVFGSVGIEVTEAEAREPMGQAKIDHIRSMLSMPRIQSLWQQAYGRPSRDEDIEDMYATFLPLQKQVLANHSTVIPGVVEAVQMLRHRGIKIGSTTGYTRELMDTVEPLAIEQGYQADCVVCSDEVASGRPAPWQNFRAAESLGIFPMNRVAIVDDSIAGIHAGRNAGCWTIAVTVTGNAVGLAPNQLERLDSKTRQLAIESATRKFIDAGAHAVIESVADLPGLLDSSQSIVP